MNLRHRVGVIFTKRARVELILALIGSLFVGLLETGAVVLLAPLMELITGAETAGGPLEAIRRFLGDPTPVQLALWLLVGVVGGFVVKDLAVIVFRWWLNGLIATQQVLTATRLFEYYLVGPYQLHLRRSTNDFIQMLGASVSNVYSLGVMGMLTIITEGVTVLAILVALLITLPIPTLVGIAYLGLAGVIYARAVRPRAIKAGERLVTHYEDNIRAMLHGFYGVKEIKVRNSYRHFVDPYLNSGLAVARERRVAAFLSELPKYILEILLILGVGAILMISFRGASGAGVLGTMAVLVAGAFRVLPSITRILGQITNLRIGLPSFNLVSEELTEAAKHPTPTPALENRLPFKDSLAIRDLDFAYSADGPKVLSGVNLDLPFGHSLALVGSSGAGKSTLSDLVLGLLTPTGGSIRADGVDITEHRVAWQENLAMVPQEVVLLEASLRENIAFDQTDAEVDEALLQRVAERAQLADLVESLPEGFSTKIGGDGTRLSGGQKQRIGIARALYRQPRLLVLDEATSALDNETEHRINTTIQALSGEITVLVVAHRLSTVRHCDQLAFLADGRVEALGTFDEVRDSNAPFARLVELGSLDGLAPETTDQQEKAPDSELG